jgi:hypothetical protein
MSTTNNHYQKAEQQRAVISVSSQPQQIGAIQGGLTVASSSLPLYANIAGSGGPFGGQVSAPMHPTLRSEALESDAFALPVARLVDLWVTKFSNDWIDIAELQDDGFWHHVYVRLKSLGEVETHYLTDRARYVCRKPV